jgi:hypothetical protein
MLIELRFSKDNGRHKRSDDEMQKHLDLHRDRLLDGIRRDLLVKYEQIQARHDSAHDRMHKETEPLIKEAFRYKHDILCDQLDALAAVILSVETQMTKV